MPVRKGTADLIRAQIQVSEIDARDAMFTQRVNRAMIDQALQRPRRWLGDSSIGFEGRNLHFIRETSLRDAWYALVRVTQRTGAGAASRTDWDDRRARQDLVVERGDSS